MLNRLLRILRKATRFALRSHSRAKARLILADRPDLAPYNIGRWSYGGLKVIQWHRNSNLTIGAFCSFADDTVVLLGGEHNVDFVSTYPFGVFLGGVERDAHERTKGDVTIGNDVWVGRGATILSGVTIGDGAIIGAQSLITRDVPPYAIAAGNPAQLVRMRFTDEIIRNLLTIRWWDWSDENIIAEAGSFMSADLSSFVAQHFAAGKSG